MISKERAHQLENAHLLAQRDLRANQNLAQILQFNRQNTPYLFPPFINTSNTYNPAPPVTVGTTTREQEDIKSLLSKQNKEIKEIKKAMQEMHSRSEPTPPAIEEKKPKISKDLAAPKDKHEKKRVIDKPVREIKPLKRTQPATTKNSVNPEQKPKGESNLSGLKSELQEIVNSLQNLDTLSSDAKLPYHKAISTMLEIATKYGGNNNNNNNSDDNNNQNNPNPNDSNFQNEMRNLMQQILLNSSKRQDVESLISGDNDNNNNSVLSIPKEGSLKTPQRSKELPKSGPARVKLLHAVRNSLASPPKKRNGKKSSHKSPSPKKRDQTNLKEEISKKISQNLETHKFLPQPTVVNKEEESDDNLQIEEPATEYQQVPTKKKESNGNLISTLLSKWKGSAYGHMDEIAELIIDDLILECVELLNDMETETVSNSKKVLQTHNNNIEMGKIVKELKILELQDWSLRERQEYTLEEVSKPINIAHPNAVEEVSIRKVPIDMIKSIRDYKKRYEKFLRAQSGFESSYDKEVDIAEIVEGISEDVVEEIVEQCMGEFMGICDDYIDLIVKGEFRVE